MQVKINTLRRAIHDLLYLGIDNEPIYSDQFCRLNSEVYQQTEALYECQGSTDEEEASLCIVLLLGYSVTAYDHGDKEEKVQSVLNRSWKILDRLPASLLKCQLLVICYGKVFDEALAKELNEIISGWNKGELTLEQTEVIEELKNLKEDPYPFEEIKE